VNTESIDDAKMEDGKNGRLERIKYTGINERKFSDFSSQFSDKENGNKVWDCHAYLLTFVKGRLAMTRS
jgi:hypothetical protein